MYDNSILKVKEHIESYYILLTAKDEKPLMNLLRE